MHVPIHNTGPKLSFDDKQHTRHDGRPLQPSTPVTAPDIDNSGAIAVAIADEPTKRTNHIDVQHHYLQKQVANGLLRLRQVSTIEQKADFLTNPLQRVAFQRACKLLLLVPPRSEGRDGTQNLVRFAGTASHGTQNHVSLRHLTLSDI
jgi:hypothetical protein